MNLPTHRIRASAILVTAVKTQADLARIDREFEEAAWQISSSREDLHEFIEYAERVAGDGPPFDIAMGIVRMSDRLDDYLDPMPVPVTA